MITADHPLHFVLPALKSKDGTCHLSKYVYTPDTLFDQRVYLKVPSREMSASWLAKVLAELRTDEELAFHSTFVFRGRTWHVPMIDFAAEPQVLLNSIDRLRMYLPRPVYQSLALFSSGRSLHGYATTLLSPKEWLEFKGRLLLANTRGMSELTDTRWIGHRLLGGFSALRWSWNTAHYVDAPRRIRVPV